MIVIVGVILLALSLLWISAKQKESDVLETAVGVILLIGAGALALWALFQYSDAWQILFS